MTNNANSAQLQIIQGLINKALKLDPLAQQRLQALDKKSLRLQCNDPAIDIVILIENEGITLLGNEAFLHKRGEEKQKLSCHLHGDLSAFSKLLAAEDKAAALINSELRLQGDSALLMELEQILSHIELDWEFHLAKLIGDMPAHFIGQRSRKTWQFLRDTQPVFMRHLQEYILEEAQLSPNQLEMQQFIDNVQSADEATERLQARVQRLLKKHQGD